MGTTTDISHQWRQAISNLKVWSKRGERAVHKPLLTLLLIARAANGRPSRLAFTEVETQLAELLRQFGPPRKSYHPEYPFWYLQSDGFWVVGNAGQLADDLDPAQAGRGGRRAG